MSTVNLYVFSWRRSVSFQGFVDTRKSNNWVRTVRWWRISNVTVRRSACQPPAVDIQKSLGCLYALQLSWAILNGRCRLLHAIKSPFVMIDPVTAARGYSVIALANNNQWLQSILHPSRQETNSADQRTSTVAQLQQIYLEFRILSTYFIAFEVSIRIHLSTWQLKSKKISNLKTIYKAPVSGAESDQRSWVTDTL